MSLLLNFFQNLIDKFSSKNNIEAQTLFLLALMNNKKLMTKMMKLTDYMRDKGYSAYVVLINDLIVKNFKSLGEDAHHTYLKQTEIHNSTIMQYKKETEESKLLCKFSEVFENNSNGKYANSKDFLQDISVIINDLQELRDKGNSR